MKNSFTPDIREWLAVESQEEVCAEWEEGLDQRPWERSFDLAPEDFETALIGEWISLGCCVREGSCGWRVDHRITSPVKRWRFYPEGLLWEEKEGVGGAWFPYSVYRARGELFIMRDPRPGRWHREERYGLARLDSEVLWLYEPPFEDEEHPPCHSLVFRRGR